VHRVNTGAAVDQVGLCSQLVGRSRNNFEHSIQGKAKASTETFHRAMLKTLRI